MNDTRVIKLLKTFSREELKGFCKFLESPFLKPARNTLSLLDHIIKYLPDPDSAKLEKEFVFRKLFKGEEYNEKKILNLIFELTQAAEDFLSLTTLMKDEIEYLLNLSKGYMEKNLSAEANRINKIIEKKLKPGFSPGRDFISKFKRLTYLKSSYFTERNDFEELINSKINYFEASATQFIIDYTEIASSRNPMLNNYGRSIDNIFVDSVLKHFDIDNLLLNLEDSGYRNEFLLNLHYSVLQLFNEPNEINHFFKLKKIFYENLGLLERDERYLIFSHLVNYCVQKIKINLPEFKREGFEVYKKMLESKSFSFSEKDYMNVMTYRNIVQCCITLKEYDFLHKFILDYSVYLQPDIRDDVKNLSLSSYLFSINDYESAMKESAKINGEFFLFKADLKNLMLKIYYELDYIEPAYSLIDSYKHYLSNSKEITESFKAVFGNFLKYYVELLKMKSKQSEEAPDFIKNKIGKEKNLISREWLLTKAEELR